MSKMADWVVKWDGTEHHKMTVTAFYDWSRNCFVFSAKPKKELVAMVAYTFRADVQNKMKPPVGYDCEGHPIYPPFFETKRQLDDYVEKELGTAKKRFEIGGLL